MRDYSKVSASFWTGKTGRSLRGDMQSQIVALYLMTSPHANMIGVFSCPIIYIAHETGSTLEGASMGLKKLCEGGFCTYDDDTETVWVHEMAKYQIGDGLSANDKQVKGIQKQFEALQEGLIKTGFYSKYKDAFHLDLDDDNYKLHTSPLQAPPKPGAGAGAGAGAGIIIDTDVSIVGNENQIPDDDISNPNTPDCPHKEIISLYAKHLPMGIQPKSWDGARAAALKTRWRERNKRQDLGWWDGFFGYIAKSDFLTGKTGSKDRKPFEIDLPWILKAENFNKIIDGKYENK